MKKFNMRKHINPSTGIVSWIVSYPSNKSSSYVYEKIFTDDGLRSFVANQDEFFKQLEKWEMNNG
tara:strand:- start:75 stop:269 length:195 start_codon:yes stop_codon:yes gene_type:complete